MSDQADLEKKTIEALRQYRKALATVESREQAEASAQRALTGMLPDLERAILEDYAPSVKDNLFQTGLAAVSRSNEAWDALSKATTTLEVARQALDDRFHETGIDEAGSMELEGCWWIPRLRLTERGAVSWQDGVKRSRWR